MQRVRLQSLHGSAPGRCKPSTDLAYIPLVDTDDIRSGHASREALAHHTGRLSLAVSIPAILRLRNRLSYTPNIP